MKRIVAVAAAAVSAAILAACSPTAEESPTPTLVETTTVPVQSETPTPSESPTPSPEPSPMPSETLDADQIAARDTVNEFFRLLDSLSQNPELPLQPLADITRGDTQSAYLAEITGYREKNAIQVGDTSWNIESISVPDSSNGEVLVVVEVCTDSGDMDIVDQESGQSILPADRATTVSWVIETVTPTGAQWFVDDLSGTIGSGCQA